MFDAGIAPRSQGLYSFWLGTCCLYIGMSTQIRRRIYQHRMQEHNELLERYFKAFWLDIEASFVVLPNLSQAELRTVERGAIRWLRPRANQTLMD